MGAILPLPAELTAFLRRAPPQALLLRGPPGCGKTTLAFALLQSFPGRRVYVSSRVGRDELLRDFPWVESGGPDAVSLVDSTTSDASGRETLKAIAKAPQLIAEAEHSEQLRSLLLPEQVLEAWRRTSPERPTMVVLDSWDAIVERHLGRAQFEGVEYPPRAELERIALAQMTTGPVFVVLVVEDRAAGQLEYLVNGVVTLNRTANVDRLERWLQLDKLRGVRIASPTYPFSLEGGRFQCASRLDGRKTPKFGVWEEEPEHVEGTVWPGSLEYALNFGRPHLGRLTLIEKDPGVPDSAVMLLLSPLATSVARGNGRTYHILPPRIHPADLRAMYSAVFSNEEFLRQVRIAATIPVPASDDLAPVIVPFEEAPTSGGGKPDTTQPRTPQALRFLREAPDPARPNLAIVWTSGLRAMNAIHPGSYTPENLPGIVQLYLHSAALHMVTVAVNGDPFTDALIPMAETRLTMTTRGGRVFVYGTDPATPNLVLSEGGDRVPYRLLLIV